MTAAIGLFPNGAPKGGKKMLGPDEFPIAPLGEKILVLQNRAEEESTGGIILPDVAIRKPFAGKMIAAGLAARDKAHDAGILIGDEVWLGKFAGVVEEWDRIIVLGRNDDCDHTWNRAPSPDKSSAAFECPHCGAQRLAEPIVIAMFDDILGSVEQVQRLANGWKIERGVDGEGRTTHVINRGE